MILFFLSQGYFRSKARQPPTDVVSAHVLHPPAPPRRRTASGRFARRSR